MNGCHSFDYDFPFALGVYLDGKCMTYEVHSKRDMGDASKVPSYAGSLLLACLSQIHLYDNLMKMESRGNSKHNYMMASYILWIGLELDFDWSNNIRPGQIILGHVWFRY